MKTTYLVPTSFCRLECDLERLQLSGLELLSSGAAVKWAVHAAYLRIGTKDSSLFGVFAVAGFST
jgi:hypothetical protein